MTICKFAESVKFILIPMNGYKNSDKSFNFLFFEQEYFAANLEENMMFFMAFQKKINRCFLNKFYTILTLKHCTKKL